MKEKQVMSVDEMLNHLGTKTGLTQKMLNPTCLLCDGKQYLTVLDVHGESTEHLECPNCHPAYA